MNVDWIVMVCDGGGDGSAVCVIRVVIVWVVG